MDDRLLQPRTEPLLLVPPHKANVAHEVVRHSPTGFSWGYHGSGPSDLALNTLLAFGLRLEQAEPLYQLFKAEVIAELEQGMHHKIPAALIHAWIRDHTREVA